MLVEPALTISKVFRNCWSTAIVEVFKFLKSERARHFWEYLESNDIPNIKKALQRDPNLLNSPQKDGKSAIQIACSDLSELVTPNTIKELIKLGASVYEKSKKHSGRQALHFAALSKNVCILEVILEHILQTNPISVNAQTFEGDTAIMLLLQQKNFDGKDQIFQLLVDAGIDVNMSGRDELSPVLYASWKGYKTAVGVFIGHEKVALDLDNKTHEGKSARQWILENGLFEERDLPPDIGTFLFELLDRDEGAFAKLRNLSKFVGLKKAGLTLLEVCNQTNRIAAARNLIRDGALLGEGEFRLEIVSKCGYFRLVQEAPSENLDLLKHLCVFAFNSFGETETKDVNYRQCFKTLLEMCLSINGDKIPCFDQVPGIYLYTANLKHFSDKDDLDQIVQKDLDNLVLENETFDGMWKVCDSCISERDGNIVFNYQKVFPLEKEREFFEYLAGSELKGLLKHPLIKTFLLAENYSRRQSYMFIDMVSLLMYLYYIILSGVWDPYFYILLLTNGLWKFAYDRPLTFKFFPLSYIMIIIWFVFYTELVQLALFPFVVLLLQLAIFFYTALNQEALFHRILFWAILKRCIMLFMSLSFLIISFSITFYYLFDQQYVVNAIFERPCNKYFCQNDQFVTRNSCIELVSSSNASDSACGQFSTQISDYVTDFGESCVRNLYRTHSDEFCQKLFGEIGAKSYPHRTICPSAPVWWWIHHTSYNNAFCAEYMQFEGKMKNFKNTCLSLNTTDSQNSITKYCAQHVPEASSAVFGDFCIPLFCNVSRNFGSLPLSLFRTIVMATGEFETSSLDFSYNSYGRIIFVVFILIIHIILLNVLTALAIKDVHLIEEEAEVEWWIQLSKAMLYRLESKRISTRIVVNKKSLCIERPEQSLAQRIWNNLPIYLYLPNDIADEVTRLLRDSRRAAADFSKAADSAKKTEDEKKITRDEIMEQKVQIKFLTDSVKELQQTINRQERTLETNMKSLTELVIEQNKLLSQSYKVTT